MYTINNVDSDKCDLQYSVPQGSILGPVLFLLYINDLPGISKIAKYIFFADDANIIVTGYSSSEINNKINDVLNTIDKWVTLKGLKLNLKKTKFMIFSNMRDDNHNISVSLNGVTIDRVESERFLGVILESSLTWKKHIYIWISVKNI